jgi:HD-GYP domain-containing protein (c-di-GMP phosphodiesterase class II)
MGVDARPFSRGVPLSAHLSAVFMAMLLAVGGVLGYQSYTGTIEVIESTTDQRLQRIEQISSSRVRSLMAPAEELADLLSVTDITQRGTFTESRRAWPLMMRSLDMAEDVTAVFVGNALGEFMLMRRVPPGSPAAERFEAPDGSRYLVQRLSLADGPHGTMIGEFLFIDDNARVVENRPKPDYATYDPRTRPWYQVAVESERLIATPVYIFFTTQEAGKTIARASRGGTSVVGVDISLWDLSDVMRNNLITPDTMSILIGEDGNVIASPDPASSVTRIVGGSGGLRPTRIDEFDHAALREAYRLRAEGGGEKFDFELDGRTWLGVFEEIFSTTSEAYLLAMVIPKDELFARATERAREQLVWFAGLLLLAMLLSVWVANMITRSLKRLRVKSDAVRRFDFSDTNSVQVPSRITEINDLDESVVMMRDTIRRFLDISNAIAAEEDFDRLMTRLLDEIIATTHTEAGILYLTNAEETSLVPHACRLDQRRDLLFPVPDVPLSATESIVIRSIADENAEGAPASPEEIERVGLRGIAEMMPDPPRHMLAAPLYNRKKELVGVILLLETDEMDPALVRFTEALSGSAAISVEARQLIAAQRELFESFIKLIAGAIDAKSPYTGGHCERVPELTKMLADAADKSKAGAFADFTLTDDDWEAIHVASWLHDCGKVTSPEFVVDKATKLETINDRIHEIRMRFEVAKREVEIEYLRGLPGVEDDRERLAKLEDELSKLDEDFAFVAACNVGGEFLSDDAIARLDAIAERTWTRTLDDKAGVSHEERERLLADPERPLPAREPILADRRSHLFPRRESDKMPEDNPWGFKMDVPEYLYNRGELHNLKVRRGTLTAEDRYKINEHIVQTIKMLDALPFPKHLRNVPEIAGGHHEKMDGTGYPKRLSADDMSPVARMMAIADIFEALTAVDRPYKKGKTLSEALRIMTFMVKDSHIDPVLFDLFLTSGVYADYARRYMKPEQIDEVDVEAFRPDLGQARAAE